MDKTTFGLLIYLLMGSMSFFNNEKCYSEHSCIRFYVDRCFPLSWIYFRSGIAGSCGNSVFEELPDCFQSSCAIEHSHQQSMRVPVFLYSPQLVSCHFDDSHTHVCEVVSHCDFELHFPRG